MLMITLLIESLDDKKSNSHDVPPHLLASHCNSVKVDLYLSNVSSLIAREDFFGELIKELQNLYRECL